ncbi:IS3 family transposase [Streptomyces sp. NBC_01435]|nr:IS3 family transposase [Streptomyces sp. NBC_01435]
MPWRRTCGWSSRPSASAAASSPPGPKRTLALFEYIDGFYNPRRIQKRLGYLSPIEYEEKHYANQAAAEQVNLKPRQPALTS